MTGKNRPWKWTLTLRARPRAAIRSIRAPASLSRYSKASLIKLVHAALALAVWYLMGPPQQGGPADFDIHAPLSKWKVIDSYDNIGACEQGRVHQGYWYYRASVDRAGTKEAEKDAVMLLWLNDGQCVASDDPRLKSN